ncbi:MAG: tripartite tricarboxylate transporter substrate binding protein [Xanthobacteraceae bacterium]
MDWKFSRRQMLAAGLSAAVLPALGSQTMAQSNWPNKPVKVIVPYPVGGQTDQIARVYSDYLGKQLGQSFIVDNKGGASGMLGVGEVKRAAPDGYTLMMTIGSSLIHNLVLFKELPYDPDKDFVIISAIESQGILLALNEKIPAKNLEEFVAYAKKAGKVSIGTYGAYSSAHITIIELNKLFGLTIEPVHYRGEAPMWADVMSQSIDGAIGSYPAGLPVLQAKKAHAISSTSRPIRILPDLKTLPQQGATSTFFQLGGFSGLLAAPAGTPMEIVKKLSDLMVAAGKDQKTQAALANFPIELPLGYEESQALYKKEAASMRAVLESLNIPKQ